MTGFLDRISDPKPAPRPTGPTVAPNDRYTKAAFDGEIEKLRSTTEGSRNAQLFQAAANLSEFVNSGTLDENTARDALIDAARHIGLDEFEIEPTIDSAFRKTVGQSRTMPERAPMQSPTASVQSPQGATDVAGIALSRPSQIGGRLLSPSDLRDLPKPVPLIDDVLDRGTTALLFGKYACGKSFISLDWACSVASGRAWQGHKVQQAKVLYVVAEGVSGFSGRLEAWQVGWRTPIADEQIAFLPVPVNLMTQDVDRLVEEIQEGGFEFIILDTIARCTVGAEENSAKDVGIVIDSMTRLMDATPDHQGVVLGVHHAGRNGGLRGSSAYESGVDTVFAVERDGDISLRCTKRKDGPDDYRHRLRLAPIDGTDSCVVETVSGDTHANDAEAVGVLKRIMTEMFADTGVSNTDLRAVADEQGLSPSLLYRARAELVRDGWLVNNGSGQRPHWQMRRSAPDTAPSSSSSGDAALGW